MLDSYPKLMITAKHLYLTSKGYYEKQEVADLVQETCFKALKYMDSYEEQGFFLAWIKKILTNTFFEKVKKESRAAKYSEREMEKKKDQDDILGGAADTVIVSDAKRHGLQVSAKCLNELTEKQRKVFRAQLELRDEETGKPLKYKELSHLLSIPLGTFLPLLARAKKAFSECVNLNSKVA